MGPKPSSHYVSPITRPSLQVNGLDFSEERVAPYTESKFHCHKETKLIFLLEGSIDDVRKKQTTLQPPSTLILLPAGELHAPRTSTGARLFQIRIEPQWLTRFHQCSPLMETPFEIHRGLPILHAYKLYQEFLRHDSLSPLMLEGLTLELLVETARVSQDHVASHVPRWLKEARDFLHDNLSDNLSLETIAAAAGVHPSHLTRGFRQHYHCTPGDFLRRLRVEYACHLLTTSDTPLSQIAHETGFSHQSHFCRVFRDLTGMSPAEFRKASGVQF